MEARRWGSTPMGVLEFQTFWVFWVFFGAVFVILGQFWARIRTPRDFLGQVDPFSAPTDPRRRVLGQNKFSKNYDFKNQDPHRRRPPSACLQYSSLPRAQQKESIHEIVGRDGATIAVSSLAVIRMIALVALRRQSGQIIDIVPLVCVSL